MRYLLLLFLVLAGHFIFSQQSKLDSLYGILEKHPQEDTIRTGTMFDICYLESYSHPEKSKVLAEEAMRISKELRHLRGEARANRYLAEYYKGIGETGQAATFAYTMLKIFEKMGSEKGIGQANQMLGRIHQDMHDFEKANIFYNEALTIYKKLGLKRDVGYCYNSLGVLQLSLLKYDQALEYYLKSLEVRKEINDEKGLAQAYGNIAGVYVNLGKYPLAEDYFEKALVIDKKINNQNYLAIVYNNMGKLYTLIGSYEKANGYLLQSISLAKVLGDKSILEDTYDKLSKLEKKRGRLTEALNYFELEVAYRDSVFTEEKAKQMAEAETRYETEKKNQTIQLLERDKKIQQLWTNIFVITSILFFIVSMVIYFFQRYRERKNRRIFNLEIDNLITQRNELSEKYKEALTVGSEKNAESHDQLLLKKAIEVIEANISDTLFGVEQMADKISMSRTSLHRKLKAITGFPPSELIRNIRLRKAASLLRSQSNSVTQISIAVGFEDQSYFSKSFKKQFGVPPSEYLQSTKLVETL
jgi:AraC-like DNA-binding protein/Tfp pilus assembly protein PilF